MAVIDDRGRLFGRYNLIDLAVAVVLLALIPVAYLGYQLFQQPEPRIVSVEPTKLTPTTGVLKLQGENLRPFLRVSFNQIQGASFALLSPTTAEVRLPDLPAGTYDVVLFDVSREVHRLPGAVSVDAAPPPSAASSMLIAGSFIGVEEGWAAEFSKGAQFSAVGSGRIEVLEVGALEPDRRLVQSADVLHEIPLDGGRQLPAFLRTTCFVVDRRCRVGNVDIDQFAQVPMFTANGRAVMFVVQEALPAGPVRHATLQVRLALPTDQPGVVRVGDRDRGPVLFGSRLAQVTAVGRAQRVTSSHEWTQLLPWTSVGDWRLAVPDLASVVDVTLDAVLDVASDGLRYRGRPVRAGAPLLFQSDRYNARGWVLAVTERASP